MVKNVTLNTEQANIVTAAIHHAEKVTSAELVVVIAPQSDTYDFATLIGGLAIGTVTALMVRWLGVLHQFYELLFVQMISVAAVLLVVQNFSLTRFFVRKNERRKSVKRYAIEQFFMHSVHTTRQRNGVLLFLSIQERSVELIADVSIAARIKDAEWQNIVDALILALQEGVATKGLVVAIDQCAALLATYFPAGAHDANELSDVIVELQA